MEDRGDHCQLSRLVIQGHRDGSTFLAQKDGEALSLMPPEIFVLEEGADRLEMLRAVLGAPSRRVQGLVRLRDPILETDPVLVDLGAADMSRQVERDQSLAAFCGETVEEFAVRSVWSDTTTIEGGKTMPIGVVAGGVPTRFP